VGVGWQRSACLQCPECLRGDENLCDANQGLIVVGRGGFADHLVVDSRFAFPLPTSPVSPEQLHLFSHRPLGTRTRAKRAPGGPSGFIPLGGSGRQGRSQDKQ
jgi:uncharacterized zinc-type alcohol dehydrogenase-like protein